jgi:hypothetical protein
MGRTYNCEASPVTATAREACHMSVQLKKKIFEGHSFHKMLQYCSLWNFLYQLITHNFNIQTKKAHGDFSIRSWRRQGDTKTGYLVPSWLEQDMFQRKVRCYNDKAWLRWLAIRTDNSREVYNHSFTWILWSVSEREMQSEKFKVTTMEC